VNRVPIPLHGRPGRSCPDCPAVHASVFDAILPRAGHACALGAIAVGARETLPHTWFGQYALGFVRRGVVVRQRIDAQGQATAVDVVGPGSAFTLDPASGTASGYAASDALVCLLQSERLDAACNEVLSAHDMMRVQRAALERMDRLADARNRATARARVAALLLALADVLSPPRRLDTVPSDLQRRDLAALLALRHESVCRVLAQMERTKAIQRTAEGVVIVNRTALESA
jgi:CRP-like cAMP-binding protein